MTELLLYLAIFFSPMGAKALSFPVGGVKMSMFRLLIILSLLLLIGGVHQDRRGPLIAKRGNLYSTLFMYIWLFYAMITVIWAKDRSDWIRNIFFLLVAVFCIVLFINRFNNKERVIKAFWALHWGIVLQSIIGWYEMITLDYRFIDWTEKLYQYYIDGKLREPIAMAGNQNDFATMMLVGVFVGYICISTTKKNWLKAICAALVISEAALIFLSTSRANMIGFVIAIMFIMFVGGRRKLLIIPGAVVVLLLFPEMLNNVTVNMYLDLANKASGDSNRISLIKNGFVFLWRTFGFGVGCGQIESWMSTEAVYNTNGIINMHNWWMEILTGYGIVIFIGYVIFYFRMLSVFISAWKRGANKETRAVAMAISSIMVSYIIAGISSSSNMTNEFLWVFWALCITLQGIIYNDGINELGGGGSSITGLQVTFFERKT